MYDLVRDNLVIPGMHFNRAYIKESRAIDGPAQLRTFCLRRALSTEDEEL